MVTHVEMLYCPQDSCQWAKAEASNELVAQILIEELLCIHPPVVYLYFENGFSHCELQLEALINQDPNVRQENREASTAERSSSHQQS